MAAARLPTATVLTVAEGDSAERWLTCRLAPSRRDPSEIHGGRVPGLASMAPAALAGMLARLGHTEEQSFFEWCKRCGVLGYER